MAIGVSETGGILGREQLTPPETGAANGGYTAIYTVPAGSLVTGFISMVNVGNDPATVRVLLTLPDGLPNDSDTDPGMILKDQVIEASQYFSGQMARWHAGCTLWAKTDAGVVNIDFAGDVDEG